MESRILTQVKLDCFAEAMLFDEKSPATVEKYLRDAKKFQGFAGGREVTKVVVMEYKQYLQENYMPSSVNSMLAAINRLFKEIGWQDCTVRPLRIQQQNFRQKEKELTEEEFNRLLAVAERKVDRRLAMLMRTMCSTGVRVSELRFITVEALHCACVRVSLKGKTRQVLIPQILVKELLEYAANRGIKSGSVFVTRNGVPMDRTNILHEMKALCKEAKVDKEKVFPHNLRHLFACLYYEEEKNLSHLADLLGHSSINTTRIYTSVSSSEQQRQIDRLGAKIGAKTPHNIHYAVRKVK